VDLIEYALNRNLAGQFDDILDWSEGSLYGLIARYLRKFDAWNVKTVIRGVYTDADQSEIEVDLIRAGEFDDRRIRRLLEADSIDAVVEVLEDTIYGDPLREAYAEYEETGVLVPLENAVDRAFYERLLSGLGNDEPTRQYEAFLKAEVDFRNAANALRLAPGRARISTPQRTSSRAASCSLAGRSRDSRGTSTNSWSISRTASTVTSSDPRCANSRRRTASSRSNTRPTPPCWRTATSSARSTRYR